MKNIGFIKAAQDIEQTEQMLNLMKEHGCVSVHVEEVRSSNRSRWQDFVDGLDDYDIAVLYSFDNAFRNIHDMIFFLKFCSKKNIRIVSVEDKVDSNNLLFSGTTTKDVFDVEVGKHLAESRAKYNMYRKYFNYINSFCNGIVTKYDKLLMRECNHIQDIINEL